MLFQSNFYFSKCTKPLTQIAVKILLGNRFSALQKDCNASNRRYLETAPKKNKISTNFKLDLAQSNLNFVVIGKRVRWLGSFYNYLSKFIPRLLKLECCNIAPNGVRTKKPLKQLFNQTNYYEKLNLYDDTIFFYASTATF
ncbi:hypothetical protein HNQ00_000145 [Flavobacterium sp. 14A]|nr:hypothetical protein [Flavobacterium sp. 14A]